MTCLECSNTLPEDATTCANCGAPVEGEAEAASGAEQTGAITSDQTIELTPTSANIITSGPSLPAGVRPRLWNPWILVLFELPLFGGLLASVLVALNWHALKQKKWAIASWCFFPAVMVFAVIVPREDASPLLHSIFCFVLWFGFLALPQILYVRSNFAQGYERRRWILPIGIGVVMQFALPNLLDVADEFLASFERSAAVPNPVLATTQPPQELNLTVEEVTAQKAPLVFAVESRWEEPTLIIFSTKKWMLGSCVLIRIEPGASYFVTNRHVVETPSSAKNIKRLMGSGEGKQPFEILAYAKENRDLALLKVINDYQGQGGEIDFKPLQDIAVGQDCIAIGNALGEGISVTTGTISRFDVNEEKNLALIRTSAPISPGNSGGALFRRKDGCLIGITTSSIDREGVQNMNFAIPTNYMFGSDSWEKVSTQSP
jgi:hypothetical protein